jgi:plastocyanin
MVPDVRNNLERLTMREHRGRISAIVGLLTIACSSTPAARSQAATIRIGPAGIDPREVRVKRGNYMTFVNAEGRPHTIVSDPVACIRSARS